MRIVIILRIVFVSMKPMSFTVYEHLEITSLALAAEAQNLDLRQEVFKLLAEAKTQSGLDGKLASLETMKSVAVIQARAGDPDAVETSLKEYADLRNKPSDVNNRTIEDIGMLLEISHAYNRGGHSSLARQTLMDAQRRIEHHIHDNSLPRGLPMTLEKLAEAWIWLGEADKAKQALSTLSNGEVRSPEVGEEPSLRDCQFSLIRAGAYWQDGLLEPLSSAAREVRRDCDPNMFTQYYPYSK
jgi:hypothetical protein